MAKYLYTDANGERARRKSSDDVWPLRRADGTTTWAEAKEKAE